MMTTADNTPPPGGDPASAAGSELTIPKHRFDEVAAEVRRLREEVQMKDRIYAEERNRYSQPRQPEPELTPEEVGLDPQTFQGVKKLASKMAEGMIKQREAVFEQQIGILANRTEKAELLASKGADKAKYIPEIQRMQQEHAQRTGTFLPADIAFEILRAKENEEKIRQLEARLAQTTGQPPAPPPAQGSVPPAAGTRQIPTGGAPAPATTKSFSELSLDEMEARLDQEFGKGAQL